MQHAQAVQLLQAAPLSPLPGQTWADLGCGTGTFTLALAEILAQPGLILALDQDAAALRQVPTQHGQITIETRTTDFINDDLNLPYLDGILMANALHYVRNQADFIQKLNDYVKTDGSFIIVEYETEHANRWVPYPIRFLALQKLFMQHGFTSVQKIGEMASRYQGKMYAAFIQR
ncbi:MAG: class I SAM-dependent methyltransferase [Saprospiraceae bacterium]